MTGLLRGDALRLPLRDESVDLVVTSPPFLNLRSYQDDGQHYAGQIGAEATQAEFLEALWAVTAECARVLKPSGSMFVELGDSYSGSGGAGGDYASGGLKAGQPKWRPNHGRIPAKSLKLTPERYRIGCVDRLGLIARAVLVWDRPNGLPESVTDRVRRSHSDWVHLTKRGAYYAAVDEIREAYVDPIGGRSWRPPDGVIRGRATDAHGGLRSFDASNPLGKLPGSVWSVPTEPLQVPDWMLMSRPGQMDPPFIDTRAATAWSRSVGEHTDFPANPWPRGPQWLAQAPDHFAAFPTEWPRRLILGWSPAGVCTRCGEGRRPVVEKEREHGWVRSTAGGRHRSGDGNPGERVGQQVVNRTTATIVGEECACSTPDAPTRPAVVLDPFVGTGTTVLVANTLGRLGVGVDLSADYLRLARWRTQDSGHGAKAERRTWDARQGGLFDGESAA